MGTLSDAILTATGGPTVNDGLRSWFSVGVTNPQTYALNELQMRWLKVQMPTSTKTTLSDLWDEYLTTVWGLLSGTTNDKELRYWLDNEPAPTPGPNQHLMTVGSSGSAAGYFNGVYGAITPTTVSGVTLEGVFTGANDVTYIEFAGSAQLPGITVIEIITQSGHAPATWAPDTGNYKSDPISGLHAALVQNIGRDIIIGIVPLPKGA